jgi:lysophospholipase L1-like esterase
MAIVQSAAAERAAQSTFKFDFGPGEVGPGYIQVLPSMAYSDELGYGFDFGSTVSGIDRHGPDALRSDFCTSDKPFYFSVKLPEGTYRVTATLGDSVAESTTTIKAELRRLMLEKVHTEAGRFQTRRFLVNIRTPQIMAGAEVRLKEREKTTEMVNWDQKLTLEFNGSRPCLCGLEIARVEDAATVYILGDSTVCDQPREPWNSWGQMLPRFFKDDVVVANHAESGESLRSSLSANRLQKVLSTMKAGDYLFVQYGHNDMKERGPGVGAFTTYKADLKRFVDEAKKRGGRPVLITSMERKNGVVADTLGDYPAAVRQLAKEENLPLIDLHAMSKKLYAALGPDLDKAFQDGTHHNNYGSYELAKCVVEGIRQNKLEIAKSLVDDVPGFDPSHPDPVADFHMPASPFTSATTPLGN